MKIDAGLVFGNLREVPAIVRAAEAIGFDGMWTSETQHEALLPLPLLPDSGLLAILIGKADKEMPHG